MNNLITTYTNRTSYWMYLLLFLFVGITSCEDDMKNSVYRTSEQLMIDEYMEVKENNLSDFLALIDKADYRGMLHAYGTYTCFVPVNEAVQAYLTRSGLTLETITKEQAEEIVGLHVVNDTISTSEFVDGRLPSPNIRRQYLTTRTMSDDAGKVYIEINREARITVKDVLLGNGYVHVIDKVLEAAGRTVGQTIEAMPDAEFSIMKGLIKDTGFDQVIGWNDGTLYFTFFMQSNIVFENLGISDRNDLLARLRANTPDVTDDAALLHNYVRYHCVMGRKYITDLMVASALPTFGSKQVLSFSMNKESLLINEFKVGAIYEEGILVDRSSAYSDLTCSNGVVHQVLGQLEIKKRKAYRVNFDLADQPEIRALKVFRKNGANVKFALGELSEMTWGGKLNPAVTYYCNTVYGVNNQYIYGDYLNFRICTNVMQWAEFKTPLLVEGTYKVWVCWRSTNPASYRTTFKQGGEEDQVLPTVFNMLNTPMPTYYTDDSKKYIDHDRMEQEGWKQYNAKAFRSVVRSKLLGTIKVLSTGRHVIRFDALSGSKGDGCNWDMIQFIPVDEDQVWPMIAMNGDLIYKGTPDCQIYPDDGSKCNEE